MSKYVPKGVKITQLQELEVTPLKWFYYYFGIGPIFPRDVYFTLLKMKTLWLLFSSGNCVLGKQLAFFSRMEFNLYSISKGFKGPLCKVSLVSRSLPKNERGTQDYQATKNKSYFLPFNDMTKGESWRETIGQNSFFGWLVSKTEASTFQQNMDVNAAASGCLISRQARPF